MNQKLKNYQDEILIRDKSIRDLSVDNANLAFKYRHQSIQQEAIKLENEAKIKKLQEQYERAAKDFAEKKREHSNELEKIGKLHQLELQSGDLKD